MSKIPIQNKHKTAVQTAVLKALYAGGVITVALLAPQAARYLDKLDRGKAHRAELYARISYARNRLAQRGHIELDKSGRIVLTEKGLVSIERILLRTYAVPEKIHWDGKWRILFFDIRERRKVVRNRLRELLNGAGFVRLQDSVWVHPYPCDEFVGLVRAHLASGVGELRCVVADAIESDKGLREHFRLT